MRFCLIPDMTAPDVFAVTPDLLREKGVCLLLLDLDNTLAPYSENLPSERVLRWMEGHRAAGISLFIVSNNRDEDRVRRYGTACDVPFISRAGKPRPRGLEAAMGQMGKGPEETALMGDQIFTDGLAANRAGVKSIVVKPLDMPNVLFYLRYFIEQPFRMLSKERYR